MLGCCTHNTAVSFLRKKNIAVYQKKNSYIQVYIIRAALKHSTLLGPCFVQFAGGFDVDTMRAFQELKEKASMCRMQRQNQNRHLRQHRLVART
jgi:hypothetical protein